MMAGGGQRKSALHAGFSIASPRQGRESRQTVRRDDTRRPLLTFMSNIPERHRHETLTTIAHAAITISDTRGTATPTRAGTRRSLGLVAAARRGFLYCSQLMMIHFTPILNVGDELVASFALWVGAGLDRDPYYHRDDVEIYLG